METKHLNYRIKKTIMPIILKKLAKQSGEEKLRIAFGLSSFVNTLRDAGIAHAKVQQRSRTTT